MDLLRTQFDESASGDIAAERETVTLFQGSADYFDFSRIEQRPTEPLQSAQPEIPRPTGACNTGPHHPSQPDMRCLERCLTPVRDIGVPKTP